MKLDRIILKKSTRGIDILHVRFGVRRQQLDMEIGETSRIHVGYSQPKVKDMHTIAFATMQHC